MQSKIESYSKISKELKTEYPKLSDFELLTLAIQIERNQLLENGLNVSRNNNYPASLEAIAITMGYDNKISSQTIISCLQELLSKS